MDQAPISGFDPSDSEAWTVLADWLTERGDPRGLMLALERSDGDPEQLEQLRRRHLHRYSEALWPVFGVDGEAELRRHVELRWRAGLILHARPLAPEPSSTTKLSAQIHGLLASEAAIALAELRGNLIDPGAMLDALSRGPAKPTIRALTLGDHRTQMPSVAGIWRSVPGLRELELLGPGIDLADLAVEVPRLARLRLACELDPAPVRAFASSTFANLRTLELRLGGDDYFGSEQTDPTEYFGPLLSGRATPALEHLAITGVAFGARLAQALAQSPLIARLRHIDLSDSQFGSDVHSLRALARPHLQVSLRGSDIPRELLEGLSLDR